jgi:caulimovirus viroplasmin
MAYYYAVKVGENPGIYNTWAECEKQVKGYPNAQFKKWKSKEEAEAYIKAGKNPIGSASTATPPASDLAATSSFSDTSSSASKAKVLAAKEGTEKTNALPQQDGSFPAIEELFKTISTDCIAYVDGSFEKNSGIYGYGVVFIEKDGSIEEYFDSGKEESYKSMRNVSGEILGALKAAALATEKEYSSLAIFHDYQGIASWAIGDWKCNKEKTIEYREKMREYQKKLKISFHKVLAHSGDYFNERADVLAKQAVGIS